LVVRRTKTSRDGADILLDQLLPLPIGLAILAGMLNGFLAWAAKVPSDSISGQITIAFYEMYAKQYAMWLAVAFAVSMFAAKAYAWIDKLLFRIPVAGSIRAYRYIFVLSATPLLFIPAPPLFMFPDGWMPTDEWSRSRIAIWAIGLMLILAIPMALYAYYRCLFRTGSLWRNLVCASVICSVQMLFFYAVIFPESIAAQLSEGPD
jgi:hypothetical protein